MKNKYNFRSNTTLLIFLTIFFATSNVLALPDLKEVSAATMSKTIGSPSYKIVDGEVDCRTPHIKRLELSKNKVITTFHNKTSSFYKPDFRLLIYNKYGMQIATANISWMMDKIAPDEKSTDESFIHTHPIKDIFLCTDISFPEDVMNFYYAVIVKK